MGRPKKARHPSSQYDNKRSASKQQSPSNIGELETSPAISPAVLDEQQAAQATDLPQNLAQVNSSRQIPRLTQLAELFEDGINESDIYNVDLNWDTLIGREYNARQNKAIAWSAAESTTKRSSPALDTETSGQELWQFDDNHSLGTFSSPKRASEEPQETVRLSQSQGTESAARVKANPVSGRRIDFSETATTNHRSSPFGLSEGPGQQPWEFDASSAAAMSASHRNSQLPDTLPIAEAVEEAAKVSQVIIEDSETGPTSDGSSPLKKGQGHNQRDSGVSLKNKQASLTDVVTEEDDDISQDHDFHEASDDDFFPSKRLKMAAKRSRFKTKPLKAENTLQTAAKDTKKAAVASPIGSTNEELEKDFAPTQPDEAVPGSKSKRPKQRPKAPLRFFKSTEQLRPPTQWKSKKIETDPSDRVSPQEPAHSHDSPAFDNASRIHKATKTTRKSAVGAANMQRDPQKVLQTDQAKTQSQNTQKLEETIHDPNPSSKGFDTQPKDPIHIHSDPTQSDEDEDSGPAPIVTSPTPQNQAPASDSPRTGLPSPGGAPEKLPEGDESKRILPPRAAKDPKKRRRFQIRDIASTFDIHEDNEDEDASASEVHGHARAKKQKTSEQTNPEAQSYVQTPTVREPVAHPTESKHGMASKASTNIQGSGDTEVCATSLTEEDIGQAAGSLFIDTRPERTTHTALSSRNANAISRYAKQEVSKGESKSRSKLSHTGSLKTKTKRGLGGQNRQLSVSDLGSPIIQHDSRRTEGKSYVSGSGSGSSARRDVYKVRAGRKLLPNSDQPGRLVKALEHNQENHRGIVEAQEKSTEFSDGLGRAANNDLPGNLQGRILGQDLRHKILENFYKQARERERYPAHNINTGFGVPSLPQNATDNGSQTNKASPIAALIVHLESLEEPVHAISRIYAEKSERCLHRIEQHYAVERTMLLKHCEHDTQRLNDTLLRTRDEVDHMEQTLGEAAQNVQEQIADRHRLLGQIHDRLSRILDNRKET